MKFVFTHLTLSLLIISNRQALPYANSKANDDLNPIQDGVSRSQHQGPLTDDKKCMQTCVSNFERQIQSKLGLENDQIISLNRLMYQHDALLTFCKLYQKYQRCTDKCDQFEGSGVLWVKFAPWVKLAQINYMCADKYKAIISNIPCIEESANVVAEMCRPKCGYSGYVEALTLERDVVNRDDYIDAVIDIYSQLCDFDGCFNRCAIPIHEQVCESPEPGQLLNNYEWFAATGTYDSLKRAGMGDLFPKSCRRLVEESYYPNGNNDTNIEINRIISRPAANANTQTFSWILLILFGVFVDLLL